jgi:hypothetical protein
MHYFRQIRMGCFGAAVLWLAVLPVPRSDPLLGDTVGCRIRFHARSDKGTGSNLPSGGDKSPAYYGLQGLLGPDGEERLTVI